MTPPPKSVLDTVCDLGLLVAGLGTILAGMNLLERIASNTEWLMVRVNEIDMHLLAPTPAPAPKAPRKTAAKKAVTKKADRA